QLRIRYLAPLETTRPDERQLFHAATLCRASTRGVCCHEPPGCGVVVTVGTSGESSDAGLFVSVHPALRRFAGAVRPVGVDADDLVQEALARTLAIRSLSALDEPLAYLR